MSKLVITTIAIALLTASNLASNLALANGHEDPTAKIEKLQQEKSTLLKRLNNAVAYSKNRGIQIEELQAKADAEQERRTALSTRLNNANAFTKTRMDEVDALQTQLESEQNKRKILSKRLRKAIAVSKARGAQLESVQTKNQAMSTGISSALVLSKKRSAQLAKAQALAESEQNKRKILSKRLRKAIAVSKSRGAMLGSEQNKNQSMSTGISSALAVSKKRSAQLTQARGLADSEQAKNKQLSKRLRNAIAYSKSRAQKQAAADDWAGNENAALNSAFGGVQGTTISSSGNDKVTIQVGNNGLFSTGGTALSEQGRQLLSLIAQELSVQNATMTVVGHTDNIPVGDSNRFDSNEALSFARAVSTLQFLRDQGISTERLSAAGYGADSPIASNDTPEGRRQNRRVEIILRKQ